MELFRKWHTQENLYIRVYGMVWDQVKFRYHHMLWQEIRRRKQLGGSAKLKEDLNLSALEMQVKTFREKYPAVLSI